MAGYLVYRSTITDKLRISFDIGGFLVNGADSAAALLQAQACAKRYAGPDDAALVSGWTAVQLNSSDFGGTIANSVIQGPVNIPGQMLRGGGMTVA